MSDDELLKTLKERCEARLSSLRLLRKHSTSDHNINPSHIEGQISAFSEMINWIGRSHPTETPIPAMGSIERAMRQFIIRKL